MFPAFLILFLNLGFFLILDRLRRRYLLSQFAARKILHMGSALGAILAVFLLDKSLYLLTALIFFLLYTSLKIFKKLQAIEIPHELNFGEPLYPLSLVLMAGLLWTNRNLHLTGILLLGFPDALAAIADYYLPRYKQIIKSSVYFLSAVVILTFSLPFPIGFVIAVLLTLTELVSTHGWDNLTVPIVYCLLILVSGA